MSTLLDAIALRWPPRDRTRMLVARDRRVARLVADAYARVPGFRRRMDRAGLGPEDLRSADDLRRLPPVGKADLRADGDDALVGGARNSRLWVKFTTGSTGQPLHIVRTAGERLLGTLVQRRRMRAYPTPFRARMVAISMHGGKTDPDARQRRWAAASDLLQGRRINLDCRLPPEELARRIGEARPAIVLGYAGTLAAIGDHLTRHGPLLHPPRFLLSGAETLTPLRRRQITDGFRGPVFDYYGAMEMGIIAWECPQTGLYHLADDHVVLHLVRDGVPVPFEDGACGEAVLTNLHARAMPFIRYRLADALVAGPTPCPCGAPWATLRRVEGRWIDHFVLPDGYLAHPFGISETFVTSSPFLRQYQMVQEAPDLLRIRVVTDSPPPETWGAEVERRIRKHLGHPVRVDIERMDALPPAPGGKHKLFESRVPRTGADPDPRG